MSAQTAYTILQPVAYAGLLFDLNPHERVSRDVEGVAGIAFGVVVSRGTDKDKQCVVGGTDFLGVTIRDLGQEAAINTGAIKYDEKTTAAILRDGYIWAICPTGCVPGANAFYDNTTGILDAGAAGGGETQLNGSSWESTASAGELAILRFNDAEVNVNADVSQIINAEVVASDSGSGVGLCTINLVDGNGGDVDAENMVEVWWSSVGEFSPPADIGDETLVTGVEIQEILDHAHYKYMSNATGDVVFSVLMDTPAAIWFMVSIDGRIFTDTVTVTA